MEGLILLAFGFLIGYMVARRTNESDRQRETPDHQGLPERENAPSQPESPRAVMLREIDSDAFAALVGPDLRRQLRDHYLGQDGVPLPAAETSRVPVDASPPEPVPEAALAPAYGPPIPPASPARAAAPPNRSLPLPRATRPPRQPIRLDPAQVLLYLGAFLIVAAGVIYASFNWERLEGGQKLALLAGATIGFVAVGLALLGNARVRPAAETFVGIGALLIPSNVIAAITILADTPLRATLALHIGAVLATLLYAVFSWRTGASMYRYAAVISASIAIGVVPASLGAHRGWALPLLALAPALVIGALGWIGERAVGYRVPAVRAAMGIPIVALAAAPVVGLPPDHDRLCLVAVFVGMAVSFGVVASMTRQVLPGCGALVAMLAAVVIATTGPEAEALRLATPAVAGLLLLLLALRGPRFYRTTLGRVTTLASVIAFGLVAIAPHPPDGDADRLATWAIVVAPGLIAAGWALVAVTRRWTALMLPAIVLAYVSHGLALDQLGRLDSETSFLAWLLPGTVVAAAIPALVIRLHALPERRSHAFFLWLGFGAIALAMGPLAILTTTEPGMPVRALAVSYLMLFSVTAVIAAQQHRRRPALAIAAGWLVGAVLATLEPVPVADIYRWPLLAGVLAALALATPLLEARTWWRRPVNLRWSTLVLAGAAGVMAAPMLFRIGEFLVACRSLDNARWWGVYALALALATVVFGMYARYRYPRATTAVSAVTGMLAIAMALRAGMIFFDPDPLIWPAIGIGIGLAFALAADRLVRARAALARLWSRWVAGFAALLLLLSLVRAVPHTAAFIASGWTDIDASHGDDIRWWLPLLGAYILLALAANKAARRYDLALPTAVTATSGLVAVALATRMITTDTFTWTVIGLAIGAAALVAWAVLRREHASGGYRAGWIAVARVVSALAPIALAVNIMAGIAGEIDPWRNVALFAVLGAAAAVASVRLRLPQGLYASTAALGLAVLFTLLTPQVDALDGLLIPAGIAWVLAIGSLAPRLRRPWSQPLEYSGYAFGAVPAIYPFLRTELAWDTDSGIYQRVTLAIVSLGLLIGVTAIVRRSPVRASAAIPLVTIGAMRQVATYEPESWQPFGIVLAIALAATGLAWYRTRRVSDPLYAAAGAVLVSVPFIESFTIGGTIDAFIAGGYAILVVVAGLALRRQAPVAVGVVGVTLVALRQLVDTAMAYESWQVLGIAGAILLIGGTTILLVRDSLRRWWDAGRRLWDALG